MSRLQLQINGVSFEGWKRVRVVRSMEQIADSFDIGLTEKGPTAQFQQAFQIEDGDECTVLMDGRLVLTGYVDAVDISYGPNSHTISARGRSKTGDLVDCSAVHTTGSWAKQPLRRIASDLVKPFGIAVEVDPSASKDANLAIRKFSIEEGETVVEALDRLARVRGVLLNTDQLGNLVIARSGATRIPMIVKRGVNVKNASRRSSMRDRFQQYLLKSQISGDDNFNGVEAANPLSQTIDTQVPRYRPLVVVSEHQGSKSELEKRAIWERNVRAGKARVYSWSVRGWFHTQGIWAPNVLVRFDDDFLRQSGELLISSVALMLDENGERTIMEAVEKESFDVLNQPLHKRKGR